ncbi:MAG TPA: hypothetical protein PLO89_10100 [Spirochaetota bacterium]|nr:hypothetical protein [Spirochaetota bacterium]
MKKNLTILLCLSIFWGCNLISPKNVLFQNNSKYDIKVSVNKEGYDELFIKKNSGIFILTYEEIIVLTVKIEEIGYISEIHVKNDYLDKKMINFNLETFSAEK